MHLHMQLCRMSFPRSTRTTLERESTSESSSSLFDSFRYHATVMTPKKQRFKRVSKPILHSSRTKPALKTRRSKLVKFTTEPNPSSEPHISLGNFETLPREFFQIDALDLAPRLLGKFLRRDDVVLQITEVEAYRPNDSACHGRFGITPRTAPVFGPGGHAYVYLCYGLHMMLNIVADKEGAGAAVLDWMLFNSAEVRKQTNLYFLQVLGRVYQPLSMKKKSQRTIGDLIKWPRSLI
ncbi:uncharacterized protein [Cicer arietinum]|uniref:DNA-3-methyladenine glycosylase II n=1 Tax=Cicer arietinum TaxID=3827 RepID=A0A1S3E2G5_CICAR|nr:DNA-3-methyladenine glycosylase isoform X4 [Cicer arietinum]